MRIKVKFDKAWTKEEAKEYLSDMNNERYQEMDYDVRLELAACAYIYSSDPDISQNEMNYSAQEDIAAGIPFPMPAAEQITSGSAGRHDSILTIR